MPKNMFHARSPLALFAILALLGFGLAACDDSPTQPGDAPPPAMGEPMGGDTLPPPTN